MLKTAINAIGFCVFDSSVVHTQLNGRLNVRVLHSHSTHINMDIKIIMHTSSKWSVCSFRLLVVTFFAFVVSLLFATDENLFLSRF